MPPKAHAAYWLIPSFSTITFKGGRVKGYFLGVHKPRDPRRLPKFGGAPRKKDLIGKGDLIILDNGILESYPYYADDVPRFVSAINSLSPSENLLEIGKEAADKAHISALQRGRTNYIERNFHHMNEAMVIKAAKRVYKYTQRDPMYRQSDIVWLKNGLFYLDRYLTDKDNNVTAIVSQVIMVGYDMRYSMPVLGFKKSYNGIKSLIPLPDKGKHIIASILYTVYHRPSTRYITEEKYERDIVRYNLLFNNPTFLNIDAMSMSINALREKINGDLAEEIEKWT